VNAPGSAALLDAWERGLKLPLPQRALLVLAASHPDATLAELAALPLGARDALLFDVREQMFGAELATVTTCPNCDEVLEAGFLLTDIRAAGARDIAGEHELMVAGHSIRFRLPATADVLAIPKDADADAARDLLMQRCLLEARDLSGKAVAPNALPENMLPEISAAMSGADPQAIVDLALECPACGHGFAAAFDIASYLMAEIHAWAQRLIVEVATLARAFGWREADVLALSPTRRRLYLELAAR
jgi:hypothetical protein